MKTLSILAALGLVFSIATVACSSGGSSEKTTIDTSALRGRDKGPDAGGKKGAETQETKSGAEQADAEAADTAEAENEAADASEPEVENDGGVEVEVETAEDGGHHKGGN